MIPDNLAPTITTIQDVIKQRRSVFPQFYTDQKIERAVLEATLETGNYAPTHRLTEPWRFKVITGEKLGTLGDLLAEDYKQSSGDNFSPLRYKKKAEKVRQASHILSIGMQIDPKQSVPEWEEVAAVAMAVQNIMLAAHTHGIGSYWSSPKAIERTNIRQFLGWKEGEKCLGFLYMGYHSMPTAPAKRKPMTDKVEWL